MSAILELKTEEAQAKLMRTIVFHLNSAANSTVVIAKELAPELTGELKSKIRQTKIATPEDLSVEIESGAAHSLYVEYGTVNMDAQPFLTPAFESAKRQLDMVRGVF